MINILHKEKDFIVCVKPQGIPSQPDTTESEDMTSLLRAHLTEMNENSDIFVGIVSKCVVYNLNKSVDLLEFVIF